MRKLVVACVLFFLCSISFATQSNVFRIGVLETPDNQGVAAMAVSIWQRLEGQFNFETKHLYYHTEAQAFSALKNNKIDIIIGPVKVQTRHSGILFLSSYIDDDIGLFLPYKGPSVWHQGLHLLRMFGSTVVLFSLVLVILIGFLVWLCEHRCNPQFSNRFIKGVGDGVWFAIVSMTTVGYGDKAPLTFWGRVVSAVWMLITLFMLSSLIALITAEVTGAKLIAAHSVSMDHYSGKKVVYLKGDGASEKLAHYYHCQGIAVDSLSQAMKALKEQKAVAGLLNRVNVRYFLLKHQQYDVQMTNLVFPNGRYAFAVGSRVSDAVKIDQALLLMDDTGLLSTIEEKVLGSDSSLAKRKMQL